MIKYLYRLSVVITLQYGVDTSDGSMYHKLVSHRIKAKKSCSTFPGIPESQGREVQIRSEDD